MRESRDRSLSFSRRRILELAAAAAFVGGSAAAVVRTRGYTLRRGQVLASLCAWQFVVVEHAARRITASDGAPGPPAPTADDLAVADFVDTWVAGLDDRVRRDLGRFLAYVEHLAPIGVGLASRFTRLAPLDQDRVLASAEMSSSGLIRAGFEGLKALVFMGYYRDPRTWHIVGYEGPLVGRPPGGWW
jgi:gluconate 2-dehydrogenase subunit 3-like protein